MLQKYKYDHLYYGGNPYSSYSDTEAPVIKATVFSVDSEDNIEYG